MRPKPSTASIQGASLGSQHHKQMSVSNSGANQNMRTTTTGGAFKKISKTGKNTPTDSPLMYQDMVEVTEIAAYDET